MNISRNGVELIQEFEGYSDVAYKDVVGIWTIGWGSLFIEGKRVTMGMKVTKEQAEKQLLLDISRFEDIVRRFVKVELTQNQFDALVSFTYNLGEGNLSRSTLLKKLNLRDYKGAADEFLKWNRAGGKVVNGLVRRRSRERDLFLQ